MQFPSINTTDSPPFEFLFKKSPPTPLFSDHQLSTQEHCDPSSIFFTFPSPFFDEHESPLNQILSQNQIMSAENHHPHHVLDQNIKKDTLNAPNPTKKASKSTKQRAVAVDNQAPAVRRRNLGVVPRKRTGKKDRHSKICTAQGIRDRRMRLSLQVARKFFDLQDMLGYDKASKTIEWLFTKSKKAIKDLVQDHPLQGNFNISVSEAKSDSLVSECEVVSPNEDGSTVVHEIKDGILPTNLVPVCNISSREEAKPGKKAVCKPNSMRESRDKARARARCRTREKMMKMMIKGMNFSGNPNAKNPIEGVHDQESGSINHERVFGYGDHHHQHHFSSLEQELIDDVGTIEKFLKGSSSRSCPSVSEYNHCSVNNAVSSSIDSNFMGLIGNLQLVNMNSSQYAVTNQVPLAGSSSNSPFEGVDEEPESCKQERGPQFEADVGTLEKLLEINSNPSTITNGGNNSFMGFLGNWDMLNHNIERLNSNAITSHLSLAGNPNSSIYSASINPS